MSYKKPAIDTRLAARTAEMLALPHLVCGRRNCRRANACRRYFPHSGEPACLRNLDPGQRRVFDAVYDDAHFAKGFLGADRQFFQAREGNQRQQDDLAIEIARTSPQRWRPERWDAARRERETWGS